MTNTIYKPFLWSTNNKTYNLINRFIRKQSKKTSKG